MDKAINIEFTGMEEIERAFKRAPSLFVSIFDRVIKQATLSVLGRVKEKTPIDKGFLRGPGMESTFETLIGRIDNVAPYAKYVHEGTIHMQARPFFEWGLEAGQSEVNLFFERGLQDFYNQI